MESDKHAQYTTQDSLSTLTHTATVSDTADTYNMEKDKEREQEQDAGREKRLHIQLPLDRVSSSDQRSLFLSPTADREQASRLVDDLTLLQAERVVSNQEHDLTRSHTRSRREAASEKEDAFNQPTPAANIGLPKEPPSKLNVAFVYIKNLPRVVRYFLYLLPVTAILLTPVLLGIFIPRDYQPVIGGPGGVELTWFGIWLEVVWLSLWAARIVTAILPIALGLGSKIVGSGNPKKWKTIGRQLELPAALFLWLLAVLISFLPIVNTHKIPATEGDAFPFIGWIDVVQKVIIALFILASLNFAEKILISWIANSFHLRTYATRIETNKTYINYLVHLFVHSRDTLVSEESVWNSPGQPGPGASGTRTPLNILQNNARSAINKVGDVANRVAGDFTGREVKLSNHPRKVVSELLRNTSSAQVLARRLFRTYAKPESDTLVQEDLRPAFPTDEDSEAAFGIFDRDLNGDVSMEELESFCDEVHREKKAIAASLKDLDSVIQKLDTVFLVIVFIITIIVFISIISSSAAGALASAGTVVLGLAWVLQATAQEFLQSIIFVFVKHPFDVGDRVTVYGNTGNMMKGDDYYVTEISLLYTEFKKMEGHIVQAPNSVLNTLFILNHRRSGNLADVFELRMKHGTPKEVIEELQARMTEYVLQERRDFTGKILTELRGIEDAYCMTVNFICFHKSSFQNELVRLTRHNKFAHELMKQMVAIGIEQPRRQYQISGRDFPVYQANIQPPAYQDPHPPFDPAKFTATRRARSDSRLSVTDTTPDFQDVFVSRKANIPAYSSSFSHHPRIAEEPEASGENKLDKVQSSSSNVVRFGRTMTFRKSHDRAEKEKDKDMV